MERPQGVAAVLHRELLTNLRTVRAFGMMVLFVGLCAIAVTLSWPGSSVPISQAGQYAKFSLLAISIVLFGLCSLFMPFIGAMAVAAEREQDTFELMRVTLIPARSIVLAKMISAAGFFFILLIAAAPIASATYFLAGVETWTILQIFALLITWMLTVTSLGVCISAHSRRVVRSLVASLAATGALILLGPVALFYVLTVLGALVGDIASLASLALAGFTAGSPFMTLAAIFQDGIAPETFAMALAYNLGLAGLFTWLAIHAIARPETFSVPKPPILIEDDSVLRARRLHFPFYLIDPLRRQPDIDEGKNPMSVKELRWGMMQRGGLLIRMFYCALVLYLFVGAVVLSGVSRSGDTDEIIAFWLLFQVVVVMAVGPAFVANSVTKEHEMGNADALNMTLLGPRAIIRGKVKAGIVALAPLPLAGICANAIIFPFSGVILSFLLMSIGAQIAAAFLSLAVGMAASCASSRTTMALLMSYLGSIAVLFVGPGLMLAVFMLLARAQAPISSEIGRVVNWNGLVFSPLGMASALYPWSRTGASTWGIYFGYVVALVLTLLTSVVLLRLAMVLYERRHLRQA